MRLYLALASAAAVLVLAGCAPESADQGSTLTPKPGGTYTSAATPSIAELDLMQWAGTFMPNSAATGDGARKTEVLHGGESESVAYELDKDARLQLACAADEPTTLTVTIAFDGADKDTKTLACAVGAEATPTVFDYPSAASRTVNVTVAAAIDTAIVVQVQPAP